MNQRMTLVNGRFEQTTIEFTLAEGDVVTFWFTYNNDTPAYETPEYSYTFGSNGDDDDDDDDDWEVVWEDTFDGSGAINRNNWNYHIGNGWNPGLDAFQGWGNGEWEWYREANVYRENGNLVIKAEYVDTPYNFNDRDWYQFSGRITTQGLASWKYGRIEARIAMPNTWATWPAFWMMGTTCDATVNGAGGGYDIMASNWSSCGEIDIMEHKNSSTEVCHNYFWDSRIGLFDWADGQNNENPSKNVYVGDVSQFHLYTIEWDTTQIRWYIDRDTNTEPTKVVQITAENQEEFHKEFFIILNLAISGIFTDYAEPNKADFPVYMYVDYVRVWQQK
jgi:beta-glucanase (GH16 family)